MFIGDDYIPDMEYEDELEEEYAYYQDIIEDNKRREQDLSWLYDEEDELADEEWRDIPGYEGLYQVSNKGRVKSLEREVNNNGGKRIIKEKILTQYINKRFNYATVMLTKDHEEKNKQVHRLVAEAFIDNPDNKPEVDHFDTNRLNNNVNNLEWTTRKENANNELTKMHKSIALKGRAGYSHPQTEEAKEKIRQYHIGLKQSEETKRKLSEYHKGKSIPKEVKEKELLVKHQKGVIHLQEDENGNLIYKNGLIDPRKYQN